MFFSTTNGWTETDYYSPKIYNKSKVESSIKQFLWDEKKELYW